MAAATGAAGAGIKVLVAGGAAKFEGFGDVLSYGVLDFLHGLLSVHEIASHGIVDQRVAILFEVLDFIGSHGQTHLLPVLKHFALFHHGLVLGFRAFIGHKGIDAFADALEFGLVDDGLTEFPGLFHDL